MPDISYEQADRIIELLMSIDKKLAPNHKTAETLPDVVTLEDIKTYLNVGTNQAYAILKNPAFTRINTGRKAGIPKTQFIPWAEKEWHKRVIKVVDR